MPRSCSASAFPLASVVVTLLGGDRLPACGIIAIAGKRGSAPTMILSRAAFGDRTGCPASSRGWSPSAGRPSCRSWPCWRRRRSSTDFDGWGGGTGHQGHRRHRGRRDDRHGVGRGLPHHHEDAVPSDVDHRDHALYVAMTVRTSTGRRSRRSRPAASSRRSVRWSWRMTARPRLDQYRRGLVALYQRRDAAGGAIVVWNNASAGALAPASGLLRPGAGRL